MPLLIPYLLQLPFYNSFYILRRVFCLLKCKWQINGYWNKETTLEFLEPEWDSGLPLQVSCCLCCNGVLVCATFLRAAQGFWTWYSQDSLGWGKDSGSKYLEENAECAFCTAVLLLWVSWSLYNNNLGRGVLMGFKLLPAGKENVL